jgi:hypothetical protein
MSRLTAIPTASPPIFNNEKDLFLQRLRSSSLKLLLNIGDELPLMPQKEG